MENNISFMYFAFLSVLCLLCQNYGAEGVECETLFEPNGIIVDGTGNSFTTYRPWTGYTRYPATYRNWYYSTRIYDYSTRDYYYTSPPPFTSKCWIIKVPQGSYCRLVFESLSSSGWDCDDFNLKITTLESEKSYIFCSRDQLPKPLIALNDINITITRSYRTSSRTEISYSTESIICAQKDHFRCSPTLCIHQYQVCNGVKDCPNGADEKDCGGYIATIKEMNVTRDRVLSWLKNQRLHSSGWGKNTPRAITALYLGQTDSFRGDSLEDEIIVKQLELQTSLALLRNSTDPITVNELAMFVNALTATCHDPRSFYGYDLVQILGERASRLGWNSTSPSAFLTLCSLNSREYISYQYAYGLMRLLDRPSKYLFHPDVQALAIMALSCAKNKYQAIENSTDDERLYNSTIEKFISGQLSDGSFGNVYTTALVTQALIASGQENNIKWNKTATARYLMRSLNSSTIDFLSAYLTLPIFNGKTLVDLGDVDCSNSSRKPGEDNDVTDVLNKFGGKMKVKYSLIVGDQKDVVQTMILRVPKKSSAYDVMRVAQVTDPKFKFRHRDVGGQMYVYEIGSIINDPEAGTFWLLYTAETRSNGTLHFLHHTDSPDKLILKDNLHLIMWYKTAQVVDSDLES